MAKRAAKSLKQMSFSVEGMTCASCANKVEKSLSGTTGIEEAAVNITNEKAKVSYDPEKLDLKDIKKAVEKSGYEMGYEQEELEIEGMTCASCANKIENSLLGLKGVLEANVNLTTEKARWNMFLNWKIIRI